MQISALRDARKAILEGLYAILQEKLEWTRES